jgi:hypothetical protein
MFLRQTFNKPSSTLKSTMMSGFRSDAGLMTFTSFGFLPRMVTERHLNRQQHPDRILTALRAA